MTAPPATCGKAGMPSWGAELDGVGLVLEGGIDVGKLLLGAGEADLEAFNLVEPAFALGLGDAGDEVVADVGQPCPLGWIGSEE